MFSLFRRNKRHAKPARQAPRSSRPRLEALEDRCLLSVGSLDTAFGGTGVVATSLSKSGDNGWTSLLQPNGDIITAGTTVSGSHQTPSFALVAYTPSGTLDTAFGSSGKVITAASSISSGQHAAAAQYSATDTTGNANKIVEVGNNSSDTGITLVRYNANGTLDTTFGTKGLVTTNLSFTAVSLAIQSDGKIVVAGWGPTSFALLRYNANGWLDTTFGNNGEVLTPMPPGAAAINSVLVQPDGKIVAGGYASYDLYTDAGGSTQALTEFTVVRYNGDGSLDSTFGSGGIVHNLWPGTGNGSSAISAIALQSNGQIVAVGNASPSNPGGNAWAVARYNSDGSLDPTFGTGGLVTLDTPVSYDFHNGNAQAVALQSNGEIVVLGTALDANLNHTYAVATLTATGSLDPAFGGTGFVLGTANSATASMSLLHGSTQNLLVQPTDGKIVITGGIPDSKKQGANDFAVARYIGTTTGPTIGLFTANPNPVTAGGNMTLTASSITDPDPGSSITQVAFYLDSNNDGALESTGSSADTLLGYGTLSSSGVWTFTWSTTGLTAGTYKLFAQAQDNYGVYGDPASVTVTLT